MFPNCSTNSDGTTQSGHIRIGVLKIITAVSYFTFSKRKYSNKKWLEKNGEKLLSARPAWKSPF